MESQKAELVLIYNSLNEKKSKKQFKVLANKWINKLNHYQINNNQNK